MSFSHPHSRLSPPPGAALADLVDPSGAGPGPMSAGAASSGMGRSSIEQSPFATRDRERDGDREGTMDVDGGEGGDSPRGSKDREKDKEALKRGDAPKRGYRACVSRIVRALVWC